jgi:hypothetical protein
MSDKGGAGSSKAMGMEGAALELVCSFSRISFASSPLRVYSAWSANEKE